MFNDEKTQKVEVTNTYEVKPSILIPLCFIGFGFAIGIGAINLDELKNLGFFAKILQLFWWYFGFAYYLGLYFRK